MILLAFVASDASPADQLPPGWLGLAIDDSLVPGRLVVVEVDPQGPALKAGVRLQDMVLAIDGEPTLDAERFSAALAAIAPGEKVQFSVARGGTVEELTLVASDAPRPAEPIAAVPPATPSPATPPSAPTTATDPVPSEDEGSPPARSAFGRVPTEPPGVDSASPPSVSLPSVSPPSASLPPASLPAFPEPPRERETGRGKTALGVRTVPVDAAVQARYSLPEPSGALVVGLVDDLPASRAGLPTGSVIVAFDQQPVRSPTELTRLVNEGPIGRPVKLEYILPGGESRAAEVSLVNVPADTATPPMDQAFPTREGSLRDEILQLRQMIDSLTRRLDELDRRSLGGR